jgi:hypothetical protein
MRLFEKALLSFGTLIKFLLYDFFEVICRHTSYFYHKFQPGRE